MGIRAGVGAGIGILSFSIVVVVAACVGDDAKTPAASDGGGGSSSGSSGSSSGSSGSSGLPADAGGDAIVPGTCSPGQIRCEGAQLEACNGDGTGFLIVKVCDTPELCQAHAGQDCAPAACAVGEQKCVGAAFERCNPGRTGFDTVHTCATSALCFPDGGADGGCAPPACAAGEKHCDSACTLGGGTSAEDCIKTCNASQTGYTDTQNCGVAQHGLLSDSCVEPAAGMPQCQ